MSQASEPSVHQRLLQLIQQNPGIGLAVLTTQTQLSADEVKRHLSVLESKGDIQVFHQSGVPQYYIRKRRRGRSGVRQRRSQEIRQQMYEVIEEQPGINLSGIAEHMQMSPQLAEYHLIQMEQKQQITGAKDEGGFYRRYYIKESKVGIHEKKIVALLHQEPLLRILLLLVKHKSLQHKELAQELQVHPSTLTYHINRLEEYDVIHVQPYGREKGYSLKDRKGITRILRRYYYSGIADRFDQLWVDLDPREE